MAVAGGRRERQWDAVASICSVDANETLREKSADPLNLEEDAAERDPGCNAVALIRSEGCTQSVTGKSVDPLNLDESVAERDAE
jgi:hypothetical protein